MRNAEIPRVVAIGASAGGLEAFRRLIENLPVDMGMAFVLLTQILRGSTSLLTESLARATKILVTPVTDKMQLLADHIYVIPPDKLMEVREGSLHLVPRPLKGTNNAIDHLLFSLAADRVSGSIGIIRSGEGSDGAEGIRILKEQSGGITMAQEPTSAASKSMPIDAIQIDHVDHVFSPEGIARKLASMSWRESNIRRTPLKGLWMRRTIPIRGGAL